MDSKDRPDKALDSDLPAVDPEFMIVEQDPKKLDAYARGLLHQLRNPSSKYSLDTVKAATIWLVECYVDARAPLAPEMAPLVAELIEVRGRPSTFRKVQAANEPGYWEAIQFEANHSPDPKGKSPSVASDYAVAKHVLDTVGFPQQGKRRLSPVQSQPDPSGPQKSAEATIRGWRKIEHYRRNVEHRRQFPDLADALKRRALPQKT